MGNMLFPRYRSQSKKPYGPVVWERWLPLSCANRIWAPAVTYANSLWVSNSKYIEDWVTPGYHKLKREKKRLPLNSLKVTEYKTELRGQSILILTSVGDTCTGPPLKHTTEDTGHIFAADYAGNSKPNHDTSGLLNRQHIANLTDEVWTECQSKRQAGSANLVESLAELDKTFRMLGNPLQNVRDYIRDFRRRGRRLRGFERVNAETGGLIRFASSEYLRFRYGFSPLWSDCKAGLKALKTDYSSVEPKVHTARANGSLTAQSNTSGSLVYTPYTIKWRKSTTNVFSVRAVSRDSYVKTPWTDLGLTFHNLVGVPWELTRLSFVLDWFVNVDKVIYANIPRVGLSHVEAFITQKETMTTVIVPDGVINNTPGVWQISGSVSDYIWIEDTDLRRKPNPAPGATLVLKHNFGFEEFLRCADASALVIQLLQSIRFG